MDRGGECYPTGAEAGCEVHLPDYRGLYSSFGSFDFYAAVFHLSITGYSHRHPSRDPS